MVRWLPRRRKLTKGMTMSESRVFAALRPLLFDTQADHFDLQGVPSEDRQKLHEQIMEDFLSNTKTSKTPLAVVMMGGPGSGKSSMVEGIKAKTVTKMKQGMGFVDINADLVREKIPEYQDAVEHGVEEASGRVQEEASYIAKQLRDRSIELRRNLIFDGLGMNAEGYKAMITKLHEAGYRVMLIWADLPVDEAVERCQERGENTGRFVPEPVIRSAYAEMPQNFEKLSALVDDAFRIDTSVVPPKVVGPKKVSTSKTTDLGPYDILDRARNGYTKVMENINTNREWISKS